MKIVSLLFIFASTLQGSNTEVLFQPSLPTVGPFPTNFLTTSTPTQKTGLQVNLPLPAGCPMSPTTPCVNTLEENQLDGFSVNPRITICFSGPVNPATLQGGITISPVASPSSIIKINQILFDPAGNCAYAKPDQVLNQQTEYLLAITSDVTDAGGKRLVADKDFSTCAKKGGSSYCEALSEAIGQFNSKTNGNPLEDVIGASLFTTMSATTWLEKARGQVNSGLIPDPVLPAGFVSSFNLASVQSITWMPQSGVSGVNYNQTLPLNVLGGVEKIAFGLFLSPIYLNLSGPQAGTISTTPTNLPNALPNLVIPVSFHVFLPPASKMPEDGFPVIIYGHGLGDNQFGAPTFVASQWAQKGFATLAMEITGHGYGSFGTTQVKTSSGNYTVMTPGRGIQFSPAAPIGPSDGCILPTAIATRDCSRQTAVDLMALIRTMRDSHGLNLNLDSSRIYYVGQSFGSFYGTLLEAVEPNVTMGTLNAGGGTQADVARLSPIARQLGAVYLASFAPPLNNVPPAPSQTYFHDSFNDEYVYRGQGITDNVPGALAIQAALEAPDWLGMLGDPLSYAGHLQTAPLSGVPAKKILVQFGLGDLEVPNPTESALVRAGGLQASTWVLRTDIMATVDPVPLGILDPTGTYPIYPHRFLSNPTIFSEPTEQAIALAAQSQIADFYSSGTIPNPNTYLPSNLQVFQNANPLPDLLNFLNFIQIKP
jgi:hypothetical protein